MKKNLGKMDKVVRLVIAAIILALFMTEVVTGTLGIILLIAAGVFAATSFINFCPIYGILGINTRSSKK